MNLSSTTTAQASSAASRALVVWLQVMLLFASLYLPGFSVGMAGEFRLDRQTISKIQESHGEYAWRRVVYWQNLIQTAGHLDEMAKIRKVNAFFNELDFINDSDLWGKTDYWATPLQTLTSNGGDCEDFSLAKYFTLKAIGVNEKKLNLTYVKALNLDQAHMVLTYFEVPGEEPLVLDNLIDDIKPASQRTDLLPVYSFNGTGLWIAKMRGRGKLVGKSDRLGRWQELLLRMPEGLI